MGYVNRQLFAYLSANAQGIDLEALAKRLVPIKLLKPYSVNIATNVDTGLNL
jgi:hypothetical protein